MENMVKIYNPNISKQTIGGGWTFRRNFEKALAGKIKIMNTWHSCDIFLISSITIVDKAEVHEAKKAGKKIVLRVDNMPRKSRNRRMSPHERMREIADLADAIVYQSEWAKDWIGSYLGNDDKSHVILNGVDIEVFYPLGIKPKKDYKKFLIVQYNRDENKRMTEAFDMFSQEWMLNKKNCLEIVGNFSPELVAAGFDFFRGEAYNFTPVIQDRMSMANIMRQSDVLLYPSYSDACPNTVIEAKACGMEVWHNGHAGVGEAASIKDPSLERMGREYLELFKKLIK